MTVDLIVSLAQLADAVTSMDLDGVKALHTDVTERIARGENAGTPVDVVPLDELLAAVTARKAVADAAQVAKTARESGDLAAYEAATRNAMAVTYEHADALSARNEVTGLPAVDAALAGVRAVDDVVYSIESLPADPAMVDVLVAKANSIKAQVDPLLLGVAEIDYIPDAALIKATIMGG